MHRAAEGSAAAALARDAVGAHCGGAARRAVLSAHPAPPPPEPALKIPMALLADEANVSQEGKLNVLGAFDRITGSNFPMVHPRMVFVFRVQVEFGDGGQLFPVRVRLMDPDGKAVFDATGEFMAPRIAPGEVLTANQLFTLVGTSFPHPGDYKFVVHVGDIPPHETHLTVVQSRPTGN